MKKIKVFAINVEKNEYRRETILSQSPTLGMDINIFKAITPLEIGAQKEKYNSKKARRFTGRDLLPTEVACSLSHLTLWRNLMGDQDHDYYFILEDDVVINQNIKNIIDNIDLKNIDFLKFSGQQKRPNKRIKKIDDVHFLHEFFYGPLDAAAYLISKKGAEKLYKYCKEMHSPIDILMDRSYSHGVTVYCVMPYPVSTKWCLDENNPLYSDIGPRDFKYADNITFFEKTCVRMQRILGSLRKRMQILKGWCQFES